MKLLPSHFCLNLGKVRGLKTPTLQEVLSVRLFWRKFIIPVSVFKVLGIWFTFSVSTNFPGLNSPLPFFNSLHLLILILIPFLGDSRADDTRPGFELCFRGEGLGLAVLEVWTEGASLILFGFEDIRMCWSGSGKNRISF